MEPESVVSVESPIPLFATVPAKAPSVSDSLHSTWMERAPHKRLMLFSGRSNPQLGDDIARSLGIELGQATLKTFTNGEVYCRYEESIRGADMFIVQSCSSPTNDSLMELLIMINAARLASAKRITAVMPWVPYSRQGKKRRMGEGRVGEEGRSRGGPDHLKKKKKKIISIVRIEYFMKHKHMSVPDIKNKS